MVSLSHFVQSVAPGFSEEGWEYTVGIWDSTRTLWTSSGFYFTASSCTSLMSQCYQLLISSLLGSIDIKQDPRLLSLNPRGRDPCLPWGSCRRSLWWGAELHPGSHNRSVLTSPSLKLIAGTKAFHINLISADAQNLHNLQKVACGFADSWS